MKKILLFLPFFFLLTFNSISKEIDYSFLNVSDLLKQGFKITKQEQSDNVTLVFLTKDKDFVVCRVFPSTTTCSRR